MRYKFRAWDDGKMYYQVRCGGVFDDIPTAPTAWVESKKDWVNLTGEPHTKIMQYTGIKDKNGVEIYEGDIVEHLGTIGKVTWECKYRALGFYLNSGDNVMDVINPYSSWSLEIIGNIYENPDLIKR